MKKLLPILLLLLTGLFGFSQNYYRTINGGSYGTAGNWEQSNDGVSWSAAVSAPTTIGSGVTATIRHAMSQFFLTSITIQNNGVLEIDPSGSFTVAGPFTNNNGSSGLVIKADATGSGQFLPSNTISATKEVYVSGSTWHLIGSPISGASTETIFNGCWMQQFDDAVEGGWIWNDEGGFDNTMDRGTGYSVYSPTSSSYSFSGSMTASNVSVNLSNADQGYNLVANPFVCGLIWNGNITLNNVNSNINVWNSGTSSYDVYGVFSGYTLPAQQGFFVRATAASPSIVFTAGNMSTGNSGNLEKSVAEETDKLVISVDNVDNSYRDAIHIMFDDEGAQSFVNSSDLYKLYGGENSPDLYLLSSDGKDLVLKSLPYNLTAPVQMNLKSQVDAEYVISINQNSLTFNTDIYLEDLFEGQTILLDENTSYSFSSTAGDSENRFLLHFDGITGVNNAIASEFAVFASNSNVIVNSNTSQVYNIQVFNVLGQEVYSAANIAGDQRLDFSRNSNDILIVNIVTETGSISEKVYIK